MGYRIGWLRPLLAAVVLTTGLTGAAGAAEHRPFMVRDGVSQPVFSYENAIRETVWVELRSDLDRDGHRDRVAADIIRPAEPAARGQRIPVIMDVSPYYACCGRGNEMQRKTYRPDGIPAGFPLFYDNYFVPRGYAVVLVDVGGTNRSTGCFDDVASGAGAVDWLNGRATGYDSVDGDRRVDAEWSNGSVGIIGKSQDGTTANGIAATGMEGVRTIVPIAAVSSYYDVSNSDGAWYGYTGGGPPNLLNPRAAELCVPYEAEQQERQLTDGDVTRYWREQDYTLRANRVRASVFAVQGFADLNVSPIHFGPWWEALGRHGVTRKAWLHQGAHVDPFDLDRDEFVSTLHRWMDRWLLDVANGIEHEPAVRIEHEPDHWVDETRWPPVARPRTWLPSSGTTAGIGSLSSSAPGVGTEVVVDDPTMDSFIWAAAPEQPSPARMVFTTDPLPADTRLTGTGSVTVTVRSSTPVARVGAVLVDYGPATVRDTYLGTPGIRNLVTRSCWGASTAEDSACYLDTEAALATVDHQAIARGWADIGHHLTLRHQVPLRPDRSYTMTFRLSTMDHVVPAGHRIGLVVGGTDAARFIAPSQRPTLTFDLAGTSMTVRTVD